MSALTHTLANGVTVICDPVPGFETLALSVVAGRGARSEDVARSGWSHLLEHMVFKGAGERSAREIVEVIEASGGQINAATGHERTSFQVRALAGGLPLAVAVTADLLRRPHLAEAELDKEKQVVLQEIAEAADTPDDQVFELAHGAAFAGQALGRPILGAPAAIGAANGETLEAWRARLYGPQTLVVSAAGVVDEEELLRLAVDAFGDAAPAPASDPPEAAVFAGGHACETRALEQAHVVFLAPGTAISADDYWAVRLFAEMLGGGMSSRLFQEARERLGLAYAIDAWADAWGDVGLVGIYAGCAAADAGRLAQVAAEQIRGLATGVEHDELARAKAQLKASLFMGRESLAVRAEQAAAQHLSFGRLMPPAEMAAAIDRPRVKDVARVIADILSPGLAATAVLGPRPAMGAGERFAEVLFA